MLPLELHLGKLRLSRLPTLNRYPNFLPWTGYSERQLRVANRLMLAAGKPTFERALNVAFGADSE